MTETAAEVVEQLIEDLVALLGHGEQLILTISPGGQVAHSLRLPRKDRRNLVVGRDCVVSTLAGRLLEAK